MEMLQCSMERAALGAVTCWIERQCGAVACDARPAANLGEECSKCSAQYNGSEQRCIGASGIFLVKDVGYGCLWRV